MDDDPAGGGEAERDRRSGPRTSVVLAVTVAVVLVLVAVAVGVTVWMDRRDGSESAATTTTTIEDDIDVEAVGGSAARLFERRTDAGIDIRVHESNDPMFGGGGFPVRDEAPAWCEVRSVAMATAVSADAVAQAQMPLSKVTPPDSAISVQVGGMIEGAPLYAVLGQVGPDVTIARMTVAGGGQDSMEPVDGVVALAVATPAPAENDGGDAPMATMVFEDPWGEAMRTVGVELLHADGSSERITGDDVWQGRRGAPIWMDPACTGEEGFPMATIEVGTTVAMTVPDPGGEQPADPAAAQAQIEQAFADAHADTGNFETLLRTVDDPSGIDLLVADARAEVRRRIRDTTVRITDLVFFSPIEASFVYDSTIGGDEFPASFGRARLVEGTWKITRSTICQDLERAGVGCGI